MRLSGNEGAASWEEYWTEMNEDKHIIKRVTRMVKRGGDIQTN